MSQTGFVRRGLDPDRIVETATRLERRILERFPASGLSRVAAELRLISTEAKRRAERIRRPYVVLRWCVWLLVLGLLGLLGSGIYHLRTSEELWELGNFLQVLEAGLGSIVLIGAAVISLITLERRWKRARALTAIHELRALAHIVDMHQLTKDPERLARGPRTYSSPERSLTPFQLSRYLDYCTELLSIISKIAALYVQDFPDSDVLDAVDAVEMLTNGLERKIWQKLMILDRVIGDAERAAGLEPWSMPPRTPEAPAAADNTGGPSPAPPSPSGPGA